MMKGEHTVRHRGFNVVYWKGNTACGSEDKWDHVNIMAYADTPYPTTFNVETVHDLDTLKRLLDKVFMAGMDYRLKEIQFTLGIKP